MLLGTSLGNSEENAEGRDEKENKYVGHSLQTSLQALYLVCDGGGREKTEQVSVLAT